MSAVTPTLVAVFTEAPASSSAFKSSGRPHLAAQCRAVNVLSSVALTLPPSFNALSSASWSPISAAESRSRVDLACAMAVRSRVGAAGGANPSGTSSQTECESVSSEPRVIQLLRRATISVFPQRTEVSSQVASLESTF